MKTFAVSCVLLLITFQVSACVNYSGSGTKFNGEWTSGASPRGVWALRYSLSRNLPRDGGQMEAALRGSTNFNDRSDYSIALMYLGRSKEAVELLQGLEKEQPGHYFVAANLGTAYELSGNNEEAARWIAEGIKRNPESHEGTEWLHLKILEAKIAQGKDPDYFKKHSVLDLKPENASSQILVGDKRMDPFDVEEAIEHQLGERMQFVKPPDAPVASLLFDYAAIEAANRTLETAKQVLGMAVEYGYPSDQVKPLVKMYDQRIAWRKTKQYSFYTLLGAAGMGGMVVLYKRKILVLSSRDLPRRS